MKGPHGMHPTDDPMWTDKHKEVNKIITEAAVVPAMEMMGWELFYPKPLLIGSLNAKRRIFPVARRLLRVRLFT